MPDSSETVPRSPRQTFIAALSLALFVFVLCVVFRNDSAKLPTAPVIPAAAVSQSSLFQSGKTLYITLGCVNCHETDLIPDYERRQIAPDLRHIAAKLSPAFVNTWILNPRAFRPSTKMPHVFMTSDAGAEQEARAMTEYLFQTSTLADVATGEVPQHPIAALRDLQASYARGRMLFLGHHLEDQDAHDAGLNPGLKAGIGCIACHTNLNDWNSFQDRTSRGERDGEPCIVVDLIRRTGLSQFDAEKAYAAMSYNQRQEYARTHLDQPYGLRYPDGTPIPVFLHHGPELSGIGTKLTAGQSQEKARQWLFGWLKEPTHYSAKTLMPNLRLSDEEAFDLTTYLLAQTRERADADLRGAVATYADRLDRELADLIATGPRMEKRIAELSVDPGKNGPIIKSLKESLANLPAKIEQARADNASAKGRQQELLAILDRKPADSWKAESLSSDKVTKDDGAKAISLHGCAQCHDITGGDALKRPQKPLNQLDLSAAHSTSGAAPFSAAHLPVYDLTADESRALTAFITGSEDPKIAAALRVENATPMARGRAIAEMYNCVGCHQIDLNSPAISQYFKPTWLSTYAPPSLHGEGNKVEIGWLKEFLGHVTPVRPLLQIHMPSFAWNQAGDTREIPRVVDYFHAASVMESNELNAAIAPILRAGDNWVRDPATQDAKEKLIQWARARGQVAAVDLDPARSTPAEIEATCRDILFKAQFTAALYDVPEDLHPASPPRLSDSDFVRGERFFQTLQCLSCHVMAPAGQVVDLTNAKAPNLDLTSARLQRRWVRRWIQEPGIIQTGTNMPPFFTGLPVHNLQGQAFAQAQRLTDPAKIAAIAQFGATVEQQTDLLLDFLYDAGGRGYLATPKPQWNVLLHPTTSHP